MEIRTKVGVRVPRWTPYVFWWVKNSQWTEDLIKESLKTLALCKQPLLGASDALGMEFSCLGQRMCGRLFDASGVKFIPVFDVRVQGASCSMFEFIPVQRGPV